MTPTTDQPTVEDRLDMIERSARRTRHQLEEGATKAEACRVFEDAWAAAEEVWEELDAAYVEAHS